MTTLLIHFVKNVLGMTTP